MLKKLLIPILSIFMLCCFANIAIAQQNPFPDTSTLEGCGINIADLNDKAKYKPVIGLKFQNLIVTYHESVGDIQPKYVSLLWRGTEVIGICYYEYGVFHSWMKNYNTKIFERAPMLNNIQKAFKLDFEHIWNKEFPLATGS